MKLIIGKLLKRVVVLTTAFVLSVSSATASVPFILSERAGAASVAVVTDEATLLAAAANQDVTIVSLTASVTTSQKVIFSGRSVYIDGNGNSITFTGDPAGWQGNYVIQAYKSNLGTKNLTITGGDAAVLVNGATYNVQGSLNVSGNEFGGIEVSQGSGVVSPAILNATAATVLNTTEATGKPTAWIDRANLVHANTKVNGPFTEATHSSANQKQYYLNPVNAAVAVVNTGTGETFSTIKAAVEDSNTVDGNVLEVRKSLTVTDVTVVNKAVTIRGVDGAVISTNGAAQLFTITASGATIEQLSFVKTDNVNQTLIGVQGDDVTIRANQFTAQYNLAANLGVTRALVVSNGADGLVVDGNRFTHIRQPAYLNDSASGAISNNYADATRGWVVEKNTAFTFTGNSWGVNAVDIAIIGGSAPTLPNNYTCRLAVIQYANNNARIDDQQPADSCEDTTAPTFAIESPANGETVAGTVAIEARITDPSGMKKVLLTVQTPSGSKSYVWELGKANSSLTRNGDIYSVALDTTESLDGEAYVVIRGTDGAGNTRYWNNNAAFRQHRFLIDNTAPIVTVDPEVIGDNTPTFTGTVDETDALVFVVIDGSEYQATNNGDGSWQYTVATPLGEGSHTVSVFAKDAQGNTSLPLEFSITYITPETEAPITPTTVPPIIPATFTQPLAPTPLARVLGETTIATDTIATDTRGNVQGSAETKGAATEKAVAQTASNTDTRASTFWGLAWYWWVLIIAAIALLLWWIIAAIRRRTTEA